MSFEVVYTDHGFPNVRNEQSIIEAAGGTLVVGQAKTEDDVIEIAGSADALLVQWAPVTRRVIESLPKCKIIVRLGIGVDNVDIEAASERRIRVCNVPDYCIAEVADHTMALALALGRQVVAVDRHVRGGTWKIIPPNPMPAFKSMTFGLAGFGRIAQEVAVRASAFGFKIHAFDPYAPDSAFVDSKVTRTTLEDLISQSDFLSLHCPLNDSTRHMINSGTLNGMKATSILVNTARGGLVDIDALTEALHVGMIAGAGLDVFEIEPLDKDHRIRQCPNALLTSHISWYSEASIPELQKKAALEIVRGLTGEELVSPLN